MRRGGGWSAVLIEVVGGAGEAGSELGAFDAALGAAGLGDYNLVTLSSVIPAGATVEPRAAHGGGFDVGAVVAVVLAADTSAEAGTDLSAGLGWALADEGGVFMEATAPSRDACEAELTDRLEDVRANRDWNWRGGDEVEVYEHTVVEAGAVLVAAVYGTLPLEHTLPVDG